ncbi:MAG: acyl-CoA reductase [Flammeovirgaceae bacterium]|nr:MAG: acyl-CoA reductase [Flammeovirgaceae bacterium]
MDLLQRITAFASLGNELRQLSPEKLASLGSDAQAENPWFTPDNVALSVQGITYFLQKDKLTKWVMQYDFDHTIPKNIGVVMAGNIPLVGFHDFLCVLISGHSITAKLSSKDVVLMQYVTRQLIEIEPQFGQRILLTSEPLKKIDAVIATGSDNSARYFEYYFKKYPYIIRKNRTSVAILTGNETNEELIALGKDVFSYFGLGCRNVSKLLVPESFDLARLLQCWEPYREVINHHKYANNYDYQKSIALVNKTPFLDTGFVLLFDNEGIVSPIATVYYQPYRTLPQLNELLEKHRNKIQCVVGMNTPAAVPFGKAQLPEVWEYADNVDTLQFLKNL